MNWYPSLAKQPAVSKWTGLSSTLSNVKMLYAKGRATLRYLDEATEKIRLIGSVP